uniref:3-oxoacyl-[acyl-carrier-protein] reductase n=1 Tax=Tetraselmis sp. GSL018 TaxID=582737 RepID=A0A061QIP5_9CHLO
MASCAAVCIANTASASVRFGRQKQACASQLKNCVNGLTNLRPSGRNEDFRQAVKNFSSKRLVQKAGTKSRAALLVRASSEDAPVALVTGGSRGIGRAIAVELAKRGCKVVINHVSPTGVEDAVAACKEAGAPEVTTFRADVSKKEEVDAMIKHATDTFGRLDVLVNNAGITKDTLILRMKPEMWQSVIDINLTGAQAAAKVMSKQRRGRIVNVASVVGQLGNAGQANYSAAKGGVIAMTKTFAREFASRGLCINAVAPGFIKSDMTAAIDSKYEEGILAQIPLGRMGEPEEVAGLVRYLALDDSAAYITGHTFNVDGGMAM